MVVCFCLSQCGPAMSWRRVQGVTLPLPSDNWERLQQILMTLSLGRRRYWKWMGGWTVVWRFTIERKRRVGREKYPWLEFNPSQICFAWNLFRWFFASCLRRPFCLFLSWPKIKQTKNLCGIKCQPTSLLAVSWRIRAQMCLFHWFIGILQTFCISTVLHSRQKCGGSGFQSSQVRLSEATQHARW